VSFDAGGCIYVISPGSKARRALSGVGETRVAKQRIINTKFWHDSYIVNLKPTEKLIFLHLFTNALTNIAGVYELPIERVAFDTGISRRKVDPILKKFEEDRKMLFWNGWVAVVNFIKHQNLNPKNKIGIASELKLAPKELVDRLSIDYQRLGIPYDSSSHLNSNFNLNSNLNPNPNSASPKKVLTGFPQEIEEGRGELVRKWRM
jgi:hypothetical protein